MKTIVSNENLPQLPDIFKAQGELRNVVKCTPMEISTSFSQMSGADVYLKLENLQKTGSFKVRGAYYKISKLNDDERAKGVLCASAGNHAQGVAYAANQLKVKSKVFMPIFAPPLKVIATRAYGADIELVGNTFDDAFSAAMDYAESSGATFVHPFNDPNIIAGTGTIGLEIFEQLREVEYVFVPIGGGGLISGIAIALKNLNPNIKIIGVEAAGAASMKTSIESGEIVPLKSVNTIADGIAVKSCGNLNFEAAKKYVDDFVVVDDSEIARTAYLLLQRAKILAEPAGVAAMAAVLYKKIDIKGKLVVPVISGGNINMSILEQILDKGAMDEGFRARIEVLVQDQAGMLKMILEILDKVRANVNDIIHERTTTSVPIGYVKVIITFNLQDLSQLTIITDELNANCLNFKVLK
ncbi:MAG: threonine ammonia-lyase [Candidatus Kapabacteria bacterium]|nr:threonine ammonia-lyase [Ignavibacteriota bacterium]MCW5883805.1 threonine ammonia-lyase [Candidatus Kapabacteria bacterium]